MSLEQQVLSITESLSTSQALNPTVKDETGFSNADFPLGFVISASGDVKSAATLLKLYPRQTNLHGVTPEMLDTLIQEQTRGELRKALASSRDSMEGKLAWTKLGEEKILCNGIRLPLETIRKIRRLGATRTAFGWEIPSNLFTLSGSKGFLDNLELDNALEKVAPKKESPFRYVIHVTENHINWNYGRDDLFFAIKDRVKSMASGFEPGLGWKVTPNQKTMIAFDILDWAPEEVDYSALTSFYPEKPEPRLIELLEEIRSNSLKVKIFKKEGTNLILFIRKYDSVFVEACKPFGTYTGEPIKGWKVPVTAINMIAATLLEYPRFDISVLDEYLDLTTKVEPDIDFSTTPTGVKLFAHQIEDIKFLLQDWGLKGVKGGLLANDMGCGKLQPLSEPVLTPEGWKVMGDLRPGDFVIGSRGLPIKVLQVYPQVDKEVWEVTFSDGATVRCGPEHLWTVRDSNMKYTGRGWMTITTREILERGLTFKSSGRDISKFEVPAFGGYMGGVSSEIDPWLLGQLIGNGYIPVDKAPCVSSDKDDSDVVARLKLNGGVDSGVYGGTHRVRFNLTSNRSLVGFLTRVELRVSSRNKFIPVECLNWSFPDRIELLRGLMDSDGSSYKNRINFSTTSERLALDVADLVRSLGGAAVIHSYDRSHESKPIEFSINVKTPFCPFSSARKSSNWKADWRARGNRIKAIKRVQDEESVCILVDAEDHLYVTKHYKLTHNTLSSMLAANIKYPEGRKLVVVPSVVKINWLREIKKFLGEDQTVQIISGRSDRIGDATWIIINYDIISNYKDPLSNAGFSTVILDEFHTVKNLSAARTKALISVWDSKQAKIIPGICDNIPFVIPMSGTPMLNRPKELFTLFRAIGHPVSKSKSKFEVKFCAAQMQQVNRSGKMVWNNNGVSNQKELIALTAPIFRQVRKEDVLDLPPKLISSIPVEISKSDKAIFDRLFAGLSEANAFDENDEPTGEILKFIGLLQHETARVKIAASIEKAQNIIEAGEKVIIFTMFTDVLDEIRHHFGEKAVYIDGSITGTARQAMADAFQEDDNIQVMVANVKAAGVGLNLVKATAVIHVDRPWTPGLVHQATDRAYRIGQTRTLNVYYMTAPGTFDEELVEALEGKSALIKGWEDGASGKSGEFNTVLKTDIRAALFAYAKARKEKK